MDPLLAAEDSNPLYEAFRRRRRLYRRPWWNSLRPSSWAGTRWLRAPAAVFLFALLIFSGVGCILLLVAAPVFAIARQRIQRRVRAARGLPKTLNSVFSFRGVHADAATDIWMTGCSGRTVAEALYLEAVERDWKVQACYPVLIGVVLVVVCSAVYPVFSSGGLILLAANAAFTWQMILLVTVGVRHHAIIRSVHDRLTAWEAEDFVRSSAVEGVKSAGVMVVIIMAILGVSVGGFFLLVWEYDTGRLTGPLLAATALVANAGLLALARRFASRRMAGLIETTLRRADYAWQRFMMTTVLEDPDGGRWAAAVRNWQKAGATPDAPHAA